MRGGSANNKLSIWLQNNVRVHAGVIISLSYDILFARSNDEVWPPNAHSLNQLLSDNFSSPLPHKKFATLYDMKTETILSEHHQTPYQESQT